MVVLVLAAVVFTASLVDNRCPVVLGAFVGLGEVLIALVVRTDEVVVTVDGGAI